MPPITGYNSSKCIVAGWVSRRLPPVVAVASVVDAVGGELDRTTRSRRPTLPSPADFALVSMISRTEREFNSYRHCYLKKVLKMLHVCRYEYTPMYTPMLCQEMNNVYNAVCICKGV